MDEIIHNAGETGQGQSFTFPFLFGKDRDIYLSELDQQYPSDVIFLFGRHIATLHAGGKIVKGWHMDNVAVSYQAEEVFKLISSGPIEEVELHPANMCQQFIDMHSSWGDRIIPLIGGYAREAYQIIDPLYPGFTNSLISLLFEGQVKSSPAPLPLRLDMGSVVKNYQINIDFNKKEAVLLTQPINKVADDTDLIITAIVLLMAGINVDDLIINIGKDDDASSSKGIHFLNKVMRFLNADGNTANIRRREAKKILFALKKYADSIKGQHLDEADLLPVFRANVKALEPQQQIFYFDAITDGLSFLAEMLDKEKNLLYSIWFAQLADIVVQLQSNTTEALENRLCRIDANHKKLSWYNFKLNMSEDVNLLFTYGGFCLTATLTELKYFQKSVELVKNKEKSNFLWTSLFQAINRQRKLVCLCSQVLNKETFNKNELEDFMFFFQRVMDKYLQSLFMHFNTVKDSEAYINPLVWINHWANDGKIGGKEFIMRQEISIGGKLNEILKTKGFTTAAQEHLNDLVSLLNSEQKGL